MENLFGTIGQSDVKELLATNNDAKAVAVNIEPGNGTIPYGALIYRKDSGLYAPAAAGQISTSYNLLVLKDTVDSTTSAGVAVAAAAYERAEFLAGKVLKSDGNSGYEAVSAAEGIVLRQFGITFRPFDDWNENDVEIENRVALAVTITAGTGGSATADKQTAKKGETVTLTITPSSGKALDAITVTAGGVTVGADNKFVMGDEAVAISVSFKSAS